MGSTASVQMVMVHHEGGRAIQVRVGDPTDLIGAVMSREVQRSSSSIRSLMLPDDQDASGVGRMFLNSQGMPQSSERTPAPRDVVSDIPSRVLKDDDDKLGQWLPTYSLQCLSGTDTICCDQAWTATFVCRSLTRGRTSAPCHASTNSTRSVYLCMHSSVTGANTAARPVLSSRSMRPL
eukprot:1187214-Rhodomonas_salina.1